MEKFSLNLKVQDCAKAGSRIWKPDQKVLYMTISNPEIDVGSQFHGC